MSQETGAGTRNVSRSLELAHFWAEGDGREMLDATLEGFRSRHPNVEVTDQPYAMGPHGMMIKSRMLRRDPPNVFVEWPGQNLEPYQDAGATHDIGDIWADNDWESVFVEGARDRVHINGEYVGVPVDIHRMNNLFYHADMAEAYGIDPGRIDDPRELLEVMGQFEDREEVMLEQPMKNPDDVLQMWSAIVVGQFGADVFEEITAGETRRHESEMREAMRMFDRYAEYTREDAAFMDMIDANERFLDRDAFSFMQGDWMAGEYGQIDGFDYGEEWERVNFPGTDGVYMLGMDAIVPASGAELHEGTRAFLEYVGSTEALERLNRIKGSIPPRRDVSMDAYPQFLQEQYRDFKSARYFPAGHALQVRPDEFIEARSAISTYLATGDVDQTASELMAAYGD